METQTKFIIDIKDKHGYVTNFYIMTDMTVIIEQEWHGEYGLVFSLNEIEAIFEKSIKKIKETMEKTNCQETGV